MNVKQGNHVDIGNECVGCCACATACPQSCITMTADVRGFLHPSVDQLLCTECGRCRELCPAVDRVRGDALPTSFACRAVDDLVRSSSSSGGVFTLLAEKVIDDGGVVFGAAFDDAWVVAHHQVHDCNGLARLRGSKYVQSDMGPAYRHVAEHLKQGRRVLFSGTPCQVAGLKSFLGEGQYDLLCVDFICHGVPSPRVWRQYVAFQEERHGGRLSAAQFRDKNEGWKSFSMLLAFDNGAEYRQAFSRDPYMRAFLKDICLRPSCHACKFKGFSRDSDITLADFWGVEHVLPNMDDDRGTSLILVNSERGRESFDEVRSQMVCERVDTELAVAHNPAANRSAVRHKESDAFFDDLGRMPFDRLVAKYCSVPLGSRIRRLLARVGRRILR